MTVSSGEIVAQEPRRYGDLIEATTEQKEVYLNSVSRGFTRGMYHDMPIEDFPLFHNGHDFYLITLEKGLAPE